MRTSPRSIRCPTTWSPPTPNTRLPSSASWRRSTASIPPTSSLRCWTWRPSTVRFTRFRAISTCGCCTTVPISWPRRPPPGTNWWPWPPLTRPPQLYGFVFTGIESGLFGTFFELTECAGRAHISAVAGGRGRITRPGVGRSECCASYVPAGRLPQAGRLALRRSTPILPQGAAAMVAGLARVITARIAPRIRLCGISFAWRECPPDPSGRVCCYAGSHTFALTRAGRGK